MTRAERRSRTELVRASRVRLYNAIERYRGPFHSEDAHARYWRNRRWWRTDTEAWELVRDDIDDEIERNGEMRNEYVVGYRDDYYWLCGEWDREKALDEDFRAELDEAGCPHLFRALRLSQHYL